MNEGAPLTARAVCDSGSSRLAQMASMMRERSALLSQGGGVGWTGGGGGAIVLPTEEEDARAVSGASGCPRDLLLRLVFPVSSDGVAEGAPSCPGSPRCAFHPVARRCSAAERTHAAWNLICPSWRGWGDVVLVEGRTGIEMGYIK